MKEPTIHTILVPIDFSPMSIRAIEHAKWLARRFDAAIHLAHVHVFAYPASVPIAVGPVPAWPMAVAQDLEPTLLRQLQAVAAKAGLSPANCHLFTGAPVFDELCWLADKIGADLIVMPTHGHTGLAHVFLGSTAERVVQHSPVPVFVARGGAPKLNKILAPVDFSGASLAGLQYAIKIAELFAAEIIVLHAVHLDVSYTTDGSAMFDFSALAKAAQKDAVRQMREFLKLAKFARVKFTTTLRTGLPVDEICSFAKREKVDLIVTATHGRTGFKHVLIGSVAEQVVRHAGVSVLVVPSHAKMRQTQLAHAGRAATAVSRSRASAKSAKSRLGKAARKTRKMIAHATPERRKTNKFRESHRPV